MSIAVCAYYAIVLGAFYLPVGSRLMLVGFIVVVAVLLTALLARLANGWRLILIAICHAALTVGLVRGLEALGATGLSEFDVLQITIPLPVAYAWAIDRDERELDLLG